MVERPEITSRDQLRERAVEVETRLWQAFGFPQDRAREMARGVIISRFTQEWGIASLRGERQRAREFSLEISALAHMD